MDLTQKEIETTIEVLTRLKEHMQNDTPHAFDEELDAVEVLLRSME